MDIRPATGSTYTPCPDHVTLCGVELRNDQGLVGHSTLMWHAYCHRCDLWAAGMGTSPAFPPSDPQWKGAQSTFFCVNAADLARSEGFNPEPCPIAR